VDFENNMRINMGQILSIPLIIAGILVLAYSYSHIPEKKTEGSDVDKIS
jgi:prolipoprotein diacylglyceryltransferase